MSIKLMTQVWTMPVHEKFKLVLLSLADQANDDGVCWPDMETIAARCSVSIKTVNRAISGLENDGFLLVKRERGRAPIFRLNLDKPVEKGEKDKLSNSENGPSEMDKLSIEKDKLSIEKDKLSNIHTRTVIEPKRTVITPTPLNPSTDESVGSGFESWWAEVPTHRKIAKAKCRRLWERKKLEPRTAQVLAAYRADKASPQWVKDAGEFIPHPATWLNQDRFEREAGALPQRADHTCCKCDLPGTYAIGGRRFCQAHFNAEPRS